VDLHDLAAGLGRDAVGRHPGGARPRHLRPGGPPEDHGLLTTPVGPAIASGVSHSSVVVER
jgi:hypothetical protein